MRSGLQSEKKQKQTKQKEKKRKEVEILVTKVKTDLEEKLSKTSITKCAYLFLVY